MYGSDSSSTCSGSILSDKFDNSSSSGSVRSRASELNYCGLVEKCLTLDLTDIFYGSTKYAEVEWNDRSEKFFVPIHKGCAQGTKLLYVHTNKCIEFSTCDDFHCDCCDGVFRRKNDIYMKYRIKLMDALCGFKLRVKTIDGRAMTFRINDVVHPNYVKVIPNEGMPGSDAGDASGDLHLIFELIFPKRLSLCSKHAIASALESAELISSAKTS